MTSSITYLVVSSRGVTSSTNVVLWIIRGIMGVPVRFESARNSWDFTSRSWDFTCHWVLPVW